jgi:isopenicillin-N N-acyltransferase-like protein
MRRRISGEGAVPVVDVAGTGYDCGRALAAAWPAAWRSLLADGSAHQVPLLADRTTVQLFERIAPYLLDVLRGVAEELGVQETRFGWPPPAADGCTSFAVSPDVALDGVPLSGQTKDTPLNRIWRYQVLRMVPTDGPATLTVTYPAWLFGHGFVRGGCSIFRNSLYAGKPERGLGYAAWGLLALHLPTVDDVIEFTREYGVAEGFHATVADEHGGIVGIESGRSGVVFCRSEQGIYAHANNVLTDPALQADEVEPGMNLACSRHRAARMRELLTAAAPVVTPQLAYAATTDHVNAPHSICSHPRSGPDPQNYTTAAIVAEPTRGLLHVSRGVPCQNFPVTYRLPCG